jgi:hypothetical protein
MIANGYHDHFQAQKDSQQISEWIANGGAREE